MCMKNRFCRMSKTMCGALFLLSVSGIAYSCSDNYDLDETRPGFLGGSIYDELKARKNFSYTLRLIDDLDYTDVMSKTGSKTLFVADDDAFNAFFQNNRWGVKSYEELKPAQKRILFNGAQLNNAYVVEMMSNGANGQKNLCLRQNSAAAATDSVPFWKWNTLPVNYNEDKTETKYWKRHANEAKGGIVMAIDATVPMMTHFLEGNMKERGIKHSDVSFILNHKENWPEDENRSYIYDARIIKEDIVCLNGYLHQIDKVLLPPGNMAEEIRLNDNTKIFSHILDRFSAPFYNEQLTRNYSALYANAPDSIFEKRYFATNTRTGRLVVDPNRYVVNEFPLLTFDPGWNAFASSPTEPKERNMGAMFVPNDKALTEYFIKGGGRVLMDRYAKLDNNETNLVYNLDQIPLDIIQALVNNLMKASFMETVPSKYLTIMNDARDQMFPATQYGTEEVYRQAFEKVLLANNGVVYVMNRVITPADYASVIAPALYSEDAEVMRAVVRADDSYIQGDSFNDAPLQQYFSTYLKAMQSRFTFFIPTDEGLNTYGYVDPASLASGNKNNYMYYRWFPKPTGSALGKRIPVEAHAYSYNMETGQRPGVDRIRPVSFASPSTDLLTSLTGAVKQRLLIEMVNQHILLHDNDDKDGVRGAQKYYLSRVGAPVIVINRGTGKGMGMEVRGGFQEQIQGTGAAHNCVVTEVYDQTGGEDGYGNGMTYLLDRPMQPTTISTYKAVSNMPNASKFLELCSFGDKNLLQKAGFRDSLMVSNTDPNGTEWDKVASKYFIFVRGNVGGSNYNVPDKDRLVRFFNNYRYTVYVPTDAAINAEISKGLKTWEDIETYLDANLKPEVTLAPDQSNKEEVEQVKKHNDAVKQKAQAMVTMLVAFLRYHFQDETLFVDNVTKPVEEYNTACVDEKNKIYLSLKVEQKPGSMTLTDLGRNAKIDVNTAQCNIMVRDANYDKLVNNPRHISSSSFAVVHQIGQALLFDAELASGYSAAWATPKKAKAFVAKYRIKE